VALITCTPAGATDNCYVTLVTADAYFANTLRAADWEKFSDTEQERGLIQATQAIERLGGDKATVTARRLRFPGEPSTSTQALHFPRAGDMSATSTYVVPQRVKEAVYEQAFYVLERWKSKPLVNREQLQEEGVLSATVDGMYETYRRTGIPHGIAPQAWTFIRPLVRRAFPSR
jgi:hypothetical protein